MRLIKIYLDSINILSQLYISDNYVKLIIENNKSLKIFNDKIKDENMNFNKYYQLNMLNIFLIVYNPSKYLEEANLLLNNLFKGNNDQLIKDQFAKKYINKDMRFIHKYKDKGYYVSLPFKLKPKTKYFYYSTYKDTTLISAKSYRDKKIID